MHGSLVHLRLGSAALCGLAGPMPGTRDASVVTCEVCRTLIRASGLALHRAPDRDARHPRAVGDDVRRVERLRDAR